MKTSVFFLFLLLAGPFLTESVAQAQLRQQPPARPGVARPTVVRPVQSSYLTDSTAASVPSDTAFSQYPLAYAPYLTQVGQRNLSFASQQFGLPIALAATELARIQPDPTLAVGYFNNGQARLQTGYGFSTQLAKTLELGGKRRARINLTQSQYALAQATVAEFFRQLRADATIAFLEGIRRQRAFQIQQRTFGYLDQLARANGERFRLGTLTEVDAIQSRVEADNALNGLTQAQADWKTALLTLGTFRGGLRPDTLEQPVGDLSRFDRRFTVEQLITEAQNTRADLLVARQGQDVARKTLELARANRMINLDVSLSNNFVSRINNIIEPTPSYNTLGVGLAVPLKFSNRYNAEARVARLQLQQADLAYRQIEVQLDVDVRQAFTQYTATRRQVEQFNTNLLARARRVLDGRIYAYDRGSSSLLEVLMARQTYTTLELAYNEAVVNYAIALVNLERSAGIWDIDF